MTYIATPELKHYLSVNFNSDDGDCEYLVNSLISDGFAPWLTELCKYASTESISSLPKPNPQAAKNIIFWLGKRMIVLDYCFALNAEKKYVCTLRGHAEILSGVLVESAVHEVATHAITKGLAAVLIRLGAGAIAATSAPVVVIGLGVSIAMVVVKVDGKSLGEHAFSYGANAVTCLNEAIVGFKQQFSGLDENGKLVPKNGAPKEKVLLLPSRPLMLYNYYLKDDPLSRHCFNAYSCIKELNRLLGNKELGAELSFCSSSALPIKSSQSRIDFQIQLLLGRLSELFKPLTCTATKEKGNLYEQYQVVMGAIETADKAVKEAEKTLLLPSTTTKAVEKVTVVIKEVEKFLKAALAPQNVVGYNQFLERYKRESGIKLQPAHNKQIKLPPSSQGKKLGATPPSGATYSSFGTSQNFFQVTHFTDLDYSVPISSNPCSESNQI